MSKPKKIQRTPNAPSKHCGNYGFKLLLNIYFVVDFLQNHHQTCSSCRAYRNMFVALFDLAFEYFYKTFQVISLLCRCHENLSYLLNTTWDTFISIVVTKGPLKSSCPLRMYGTVSIWQNNFKENLRWKIIFDFLHFVASTSIFRWWIETDLYSFNRLS